MYVDVTAATAATAAVAAVAATSRLSLGGEGVKVSDVVIFVNAGAELTLGVVAGCRRGDSGGPETRDLAVSCCPGGGRNDNHSWGLLVVCDCPCCAVALRCDGAGNDDESLGKHKGGQESCGPLA